MIRLTLGNMLLFIFMICLVSSKEIVKDCKMDEVLYKNGEQWNTKCMKHNCKLGIIQSTINKSCCHVEESGVYMDGEAWSNGCWINYCKDGSVDSLLDATCCVSGNNTYKNGKFWYKGAILYICAYGTDKIALDYQDNLDLQLPSVPEIVGNDLKLLRRKRRASAWHMCSDQERTVEQVDMRSWNQNCYRKKCRWNQAIWEVDKYCCEFEGVAYPDGAAWSVKCTLYFCNAGESVEQEDESCCEYKEKQFPHGHLWDTEDDDCHHKECIAGTIKKTNKDSCCEDDGVLYADGEYWFTSNPKWVCRDGEQERLLDSEEFCTFDRKVYKTGEIWKKDCYTYSCNRSLIFSSTDHDCMVRLGKNCDHIMDETESEPNALCASSGGSCNNEQDQSGVCRSSCGPGEFSIGQCDGKSCSCCRMSNTANDTPVADSTRDCILDGNTLDNGRSKVVQSICVTYMCSNGELLQANIENCQIYI